MPLTAPFRGPLAPIECLIVSSFGAVILRVPNWLGQCRFSRTAVHAVRPARRERQTAMVEAGSGRYVVHACSYLFRRPRTGALLARQGRHVFPHVSRVRNSSENSSCNGFFCVTVS